MLYSVREFVLSNVASVTLIARNLLIAFRAPLEARTLDLPHFRTAMAFFFFQRLPRYVLGMDLITSSGLSSLLGSIVPIYRSICIQSGKILRI